MKRIRLNKHKSQEHHAYSDSSSHQKPRGILGSIPSPAFSGLELPSLPAPSPNPVAFFSIGSTDRQEGDSAKPLLRFLRIHHLRALSALRARELPDGL